MSEKKDAPPVPAAAAAPVVLGPTKTNIWRCKVQDKDGRAVHLAEGMETLVIKGPASRDDALRHIRILLNSKRADAIRIGETDPGYRMVDGSLEPAGYTDADVFDGFVPEGARPLNLPTDAKVRDAHDKLIAEKLGTNP